MARSRFAFRRHIEITSGRLLICDPPFAGLETIDRFPGIRMPDNSALSSRFGGDGDFKLYSDGTTLVVDTAPRLFKQKQRRQFEQLPGKVAVDYGLIGFMDASTATDEADLDLCVVLPFPNGKYCVWAEVAESQALRDRILCIGPDAVPILSEPTTSTRRNPLEEVAFSELVDPITTRVPDAADELRQYMRRTGLLVRHGLLPSEADEERGLHYGLFADSHFVDLAEFLVFVHRSAGSHQAWFSSGSVEIGLEWMGDGDPCDSVAELKKYYRGSRGSVGTALAQAGFDYPEIAGLRGSILATRGSEDYSLIAKTDKGYLCVLDADILG